MKKMTDFEKKRLIKECHKVLDEVEKDIKLMGILIEQKSLKKAA